MTRYRCYLAWRSRTLEQRTCLYFENDRMAWAAIVDLLSEPSELVSVTLWRGTTCVGQAFPPAGVMDVPLQGEQVVGACLYTIH